MAVNIPSQVGADVGWFFHGVDLDRRCSGWNDHCSLRLYGDQLVPSPWLSTLADGITGQKCGAVSAWTDGG